MTDPGGPLAMYGGTFDPIHIGHVRAAVELRERLGFAQVVIIPAGKPMHREPPKANAKHRLAMCRAAIAGNPSLVVDDCEIQRSGPSYTVDTLADLRRRFPGTSLCLVLGTDAFNSLDCWHQPERITELAHVLVLNRPGVELRTPALFGKLRPIVASHRRLTAALAGGLFKVDLPQRDVSASRVRRSLFGGADTGDMLPCDVARYIEEHRLYR